MASTKSDVDGTKEAELHRMRSIDLHSQKSLTVDDAVVSVIKSDHVQEVPKNDLIYFTVWTGAKKSFQFLRTCKLEVIMFIYMFAYVIRSVSSMTMLMDKACRVNLGYSDEICGNLKAHDFVKKEVEKLANNVHLGHTLLAITPSAILSSFIAPWSEKYGRKPPIIAALVGIIIDGVGATMCAYFMDSRAEFFLLPSIATGLSGGIVSVLTVIYCYVSDVTAYENRTIRYTLLELSFGLGLPAGQLAGGIIFKYYGYLPVFATSLASHLFGLIWVVFVLEETRGLDNKESWNEKIRNLFRFESMKESFRAAVKERPHRIRLQLWMLLLTMIISVLVMAGSMGISYTFVHDHYDWGNTKYSTIASIYSIMGIVVMSISVAIFTKLLKFSDPVLGIIGSASSLAKTLGIAVAARQGIYFLAMLLGLMGGLANLAGRSRLSKIIPKGDLGKIFAFLSTVEALMPVLASAIITQIFNATIGIIPDPSYTLMAACLVVMMGVYIWMSFLPNVNYKELQEKYDEEAGKKEETDTAIKMTDLSKAE